MDTTLINLYIFNETRRGAIYGVGTYIRELTAALKNSDINICVVNLTSDKPQIQTEEIDGIKYWYFPSAISEQRTTDNQKQWELYFRNVVYLLRLHIQDKKKLIFHLNYCQSGKLAEELKNAFACKVISVAHFSGWGFSVYDNPERLRKILNEEYPERIKGMAGQAHHDKTNNREMADDPESSSGRNDNTLQQDIADQARNNNSLEENVKKSFEDERLYYTKADHVICLSNYMREILCR